MAVGSWAPTAQNSQELHFRLIDSFIQPSLVEPLFHQNYYSQGRGKLGRSSKRRQKLGKKEK